MKFTKLFFVALISSIFFVSCTDDEINETPLGIYDNGVLILNQGGFGKGNASISYLSEDFVTQQNNIFALANPTILLGDTGQDVGLFQNLAFIVLNNSNKIEVVNRYTFRHVATISKGLSNPRYITFSNEKAFVTNWGDGGNKTDDFVAVVNLDNYSVVSSISVAEGPEKIIENNSKLYVAHQGGYGYGNTISVIDATKNSFANSINVGDVPNSLEINNGSLFVICGGKPSYSGSETAGSFQKINLLNNTVSSTLNFSEKTQHPSNLDIEGSDYYFTINSNIFKSQLTATTLPTTSLFNTKEQGEYGIYSFAVRNNKIYLGDAGDYVSNGKIYIHSTAGVFEKQFAVGIIPAGFYFN